MFHIAAPSVASIDSGISNAVRESSKLSMTKVLENGKTKIAISAEKEPGKKTVPICRRIMVISVRNFVISPYRKQICLK